MSKKYSTKSPEERKQEMTEILKNLEDGVRGVFTSENYINYLKTFSKFHSYSFNNIILIMLQCPNASHVASYKDWNEKFHRVVKKGEKGITILVPTPKKVVTKEQVNNPDGTITETEIERKHLYFKKGYVFDVSQTMGDELPTLVKDLDFETPELHALINKLIGDSKIPIKYDYNLDNENSPKGYYNILTQEIYLNPSLKALHKLKTIIHEYSHFLQETLFITQTKEFDRNTKEVVAESCAFSVIEMLSNELNMEKLDSSQYSFPYIAGWGNKDLKELKSTLDIISKLSNQIFIWISNQF